MSQFLKGQRYEGTIIEAAGENHWIVSLQGKLFRVQNNTDNQFQTDQRIRLEVQVEKPLQFRILGRLPFQRGHLRVRV